MSKSRELDELAHKIAYADSCVAIESNTFAILDEDWYDIANGVGESAREYVETAVRYLEMRGLIERDPARPGCIRICDESEATA